MSCDEGDSEGFVDVSEDERMVVRNASYLLPRRMASGVDPTIFDYSFSTICMRRWLANFVTSRRARTGSD